MRRAAVRLRLLAVLAALAVVLVVAALLLPVYSGRGRRSLSTACLSKLKQIGTGTLIYAADYEDRIPPSASWMDALVPFTKNESLLHCPALQEQKLPGYGYALNRHLEGMKLSSLKSPGEVPLLYESINLARNAADFVTSVPNPGRHQGRNFMVRVDSSAKAFPGSP